jgi:hypothetical protein
MRGDLFPLVLLAVAGCAADPSSSTTAIEVAPEQAPESAEISTSRSTLGFEHRDAHRVHHLDLCRYDGSALDLTPGKHYDGGPGFGGRGTIYDGYVNKDGTVNTAGKALTWVDLSFCDDGVCGVASVVEVDIAAAGPGAIRISYEAFRAAGDEAPSWSGSFAVPVDGFYDDIDATDYSWNPDLHG